MSPGQSRPWVKGGEIYHLAMENEPFIDAFPMTTSIYSGFSMAMLNNIHKLVGGLEHFIFFHILGIIILIDEYFSEGLKPPTSYGCGTGDVLEQRRRHSFLFNGEIQLMPAGNLKIAFHSGIYP